MLVIQFIVLFWKFQFSTEGRREHVNFLQEGASFW